MSEKTKVRPALTPEEWEHPGDIFDGYLDMESAVDIRFGGPAGIRDPGKEAHALAALCLHGQPFGFTWEDVDALMDSPPDEARLTEIAERVVALLPPREARHG